jgi:hypothetical protein
MVIKLDQSNLLLIISRSKMSVEYKTNWTPVFKVFGLDLLYFSYRIKLIISITLSLKVIIHSFYYKT